MRGRAKSGASRMGLEKRIKRGDGRSRPSGKQNKTQEKGGIKRSKSGRTEPSKAKAIRAKRWNSA